MKSCTLSSKKSSAKPVSVALCAQPPPCRLPSDPVIFDLRGVPNLRGAWNFLKTEIANVGAFAFSVAGSRGGITQVKVAFMGNVKRTLVRNVKGPVRKNDILALLESEREARRLR